MNDKILCFKIDGNDLYLLISLVHFNEIPIFFLCRDKNGVTYAVQCTDTEDLNYYVVQVSRKNILELLNNTLTIRDFMNSSNKKWEIQSGENIEDDIVKQIEILNKEDLVDEGVFLKLNNKEIEVFKDKINKEINIEFTKQKYQNAVAVNTKISELTVSNAKNPYVFNRELNSLTKTNKIIPFTNKTDLSEKNNHSKISNIMLQSIKDSGYKTSSENSIVKMTHKYELTKIMATKKQETIHFCS